MTDLSGMDLDWFFATKDGKIIHLATAGGDVPTEVDEYYLDDVADVLGELDGDDYDYIINPDLENILKANDRKPIMKYYLETFIDMAKMGIFSFDRSDINGNSNNYHFVAGPKDKFLSANDIQELKDCILVANKDIELSTFNIDEIQFNK